MSAAFLKWAFMGLLTLILGVMTFFFDTTYEWVLTQLPVEQVLPDFALPYVGVGAWLAIKLRMPEIVSLFTSAQIIRMTIRLIPFVGKAIAG